ncbi:hypothetical protein [Agaribacter marinus]|uniref:Uncharacterized protein n=1 Tax=Agaribacter marinus TaxID=1431249 RepID=A0AA37SUS8_9ALTE|nr:hypothetical protein [Agaribacter marinus]GLR69622.1 hypothetical protein GCM10007852_05300 [Agaribacter marinus]
MLILNYAHYLLKDIDIGKHNVDRTPPRAQDSAWYKKHLLISLVTHMLISLCVLLVPSIKSKDITRIKRQAEPVKSYLTVMPRPTIDKEIQSSPRVAEQQRYALETDTSKLNTETNDDAKRALSSESSDIATPTMEQSNLAESKQIVAAAAQIVPEPILKVIDEASTNEPHEFSVTIDKRSIADAVRDYQIQLDAETISAIAKDASMVYQQKKLSPNIDTSVKPTEELMQARRRRIEVDCSRSIKKVFANISSLTGGRVECRTSNAFQQFIDKRLYKGEEKE